MVTLTPCKRLGTDYLTQNHAWLVYLPADTYVFCGAELAGTTYGSYNAATDDCTHSYAGTHDLKAVLYVNPGAVAHGEITY